jgi:hypothetical protein
MINTQINNYPNIRRFAFVFEYLFHKDRWPFPYAKHEYLLDKRRRVFLERCSFFEDSLGIYRASCKLMCFAWSSIFISLVFSIVSLYFFRIQLLKLTNPFILLLVGGISATIYFLVPQFISRLITSFAMWKIPEELIYTVFKEPRKLNGFREFWKRKYRIRYIDIVAGNDIFIKLAYERFRNTFLYLVPSLITPPFLTFLINTLL